MARRSDVPSIQRCNLATLPENYNSNFYLHHLRSWPELALVMEYVPSPADKRNNDISSNSDGGGGISSSSGAGSSTGTGSGSGACSGDISSSSGGSSSGGGGGGSISSSSSTGSGSGAGSGGISSSGGGGDISSSSGGGGGISSSGGSGGGSGAVKLLQKLWLKLEEKCNKRKSAKCHLLKVVTIVFLFEFRKINCSFVFFNFLICIYLVILISNLSMKI